VLESKRKEAESDAQTALILTLVGFFVCGIILGLIAFPKANNALEIIKIYEVAQDSHSMAMLRRCWPSSKFLAGRLYCSYKSLQRCCAIDTR
jgi:hypothetical protein